MTPEEIPTTRPLLWCLDAFGHDFIHWRVQPTGFGLLAKTRRAATGWFDVHKDLPNVEEAPSRWRWVVPRQSPGRRRAAVSAPSATQSNPICRRDRWLRQFKSPGWRQTVGSFLPRMESWLAQVASASPPCPHSPGSPGRGWDSPARHHGGGRGNRIFTPIPHPQMPSAEDTTHDAGVQPIVKVHQGPKRHQGW